MSVIVGYARTPFVRFNGVFTGVPATELGAHALRAALERAGVPAPAVQLTVAGQVLQGGAGQNPARQTAVGAGVPMTVPATTLNAVCLSGMEAVVHAHRVISTGEYDVVAAVGQESMSLAPHVWVSSRAGQRYGSVTLLDTVEHDGLTDAFERDSMGASTERHGASYALSREAQDAFAAASHQRAAAGAAALAEEIASFTTSGRRGVTVEADDGVRPDTTADVLAGLRPAFSPEGTITAGNASQISDGAAALVVVSDAYAQAHGLTGPRVLAHALVAGPDVALHAQPANAVNAALKHAGLAAGDLAAVEINEAFAAVGIASTDLLGVDPAIVNANGGAIALGHPIGASGARIVGHLGRRLGALGSGSVGAAALCGGGGQGSAVLLAAP
ncbi:acetyl-CoA acetyltransferase [Beutenbergia cavernae DSM 12333]|uniref:Probable acetyl-CoA acetyltransferase n=1 Tax=Beutenbergia cavernae (strain ATCC BAA-8 / DSM 12333 / CCUG 43141 / JCM 11478 / NBRC 16432 / NCIMB 13614 / HKI 0122) TaxID=471853 RepID=C5C4G3_BEUC1|nr:acetyl-CoA C-acyltransferase [Beutenbergia cavernae]ACQ82087.1 acetyl-CoA acetyltransferase [Beutenbergia cavernae DSM 12333]